MIKPLSYNLPIQPVCTSVNCCMNLPKEEMLLKKKCCKKYKKKGKRCKSCPGRVD